MIRIDRRTFINDDEIEESFVRSSGPGGQNVNKVASAVQLRFDLQRASGLPDDVRARLVRLAGRRLTREGVIVIEAQRFRTQERNRADAMERLVDLVTRAAEAPVPRRPTKPTVASKRRRLDAKRIHGSTKSQRRRPSVQD